MPLLFLGVGFCSRDDLIDLFCRQMARHEALRPLSAPPARQKPRASRISSSHSHHFSSVSSAPFPAPLILPRFRQIALVALPSNSSLLTGKILPKVLVSTWLVSLLATAPPAADPPYLRSLLAQRPSYARLYARPAAYTLPTTATRREFLYLFGLHRLSPPSTALASKLRRRHGAHASWISARSYRLVCSSLGLASQLA